MLLNTIKVPSKGRFYDIIEALKGREQKRDIYPTMDDFMPRYIEVANAYKAQ